MRLKLVEVNLDQCPERQDLQRGVAPSGGYSMNNGTTWHHMPRKSSVVEIVPTDPAVNE